MADLGTVPVAVYRLKARKQPATAQMWFLNGGPGGSGFSLVRYADRVASSFAQGVDTYLIDHRGTGESTFLECPKATRASKDLDAFAVECSQEIRELSGDKLDGFGTTESAHDVRELIDATAEPDKKVVVYGGSYGSYWAHRLLQLPNVHVDAVITDGNCLSSTCTFDTPQSFGMDEVVKNIAEVCKEQEACRARFGPDPWGKIRDIVRKLNEGHCAEAALAQMAPADLILNLGPMWAAGILPLLYRLDRCSAGDLAALGALAGVFTRIDQGSRANATVDVVPSDQFLRRIPRLGETPAPTSRTSFSTALQTHVVASELVSLPVPSKESLAARAESLTFQPDPSAFDLGYLAKWQGYPKDAAVGGWMNRDVPWLMLQGTFDFQTVYSMSQAALPKITDPSLQFVRIDGGNHGVAFDSDCTLKMVERFVAAPTAKVKAACVSEVKAESVTPDPGYADYFFGTRDPWD